MYYILLIIIIISILYYKFNQSDILNEVESFKDLYNLKKKGASLKLRRTMRCEPFNRRGEHTKSRQ